MQKFKALCQLVLKRRTSDKQFTLDKLDTILTICFRLYSKNINLTDHFLQCMTCLSIRLIVCCFSQCVWPYFLLWPFFFQLFCGLYSTTFLPITRNKEKALLLPPVLLQKRAIHHHHNSESERQWFSIKSADKWKN